jgi:hypothetical protein
MLVLELLALELLLFQVQASHHVSMDTSAASSNFQASRTCKESSPCPLLELQSHCCCHLANADSAVAASELAPLQTPP